MTEADAIKNIYQNFSKFGVSYGDAMNMVTSGVHEYQLTVEAVYNILRMQLSITFGVHEYFTVEDVMSITGETREEVLERIETEKLNLKAAGKDPDDYFIQVEPLKSKTFYFPNGLGRKDG